MHPMRRLLHRLAAGAALAFSPLAAYDTDTHYYVTYLIMRDSGFDVAAAKGVASLVEYVDFNSRTDANPFTGTPEQRRTWHFTAARNKRDVLVTWYWEYGSTVQNSPWGKHNVNLSLERNDAFRLGMAVHPYQDTYSHECFDAKTGHLWDLARPDVPSYRLDNFVKMVTKVYSIIKKFRANNGLPTVERSLSEQWYRNAATKASPKNWGDFVLGDKRWRAYNLQPRIDYWKQRITERFEDPGEPLTPTGPDMSKYNALVDGFPLPDNDLSKVRREEWSGRGAVSVATPAPSEVPPPERPTTSSAVDEALVARILEMPLKWGARTLATEAPHLCLDARVQARLTCEAGLGALLDLASPSDDRSLLSMVLSRWDLSLVDLAGLLEERLDSDPLRVRLYCASMLASNFVVSDLCAERIRGVFQEAAGLSLTPADRAYLLACLPTDPAAIASRAPAALDLYRRFLDDPDLAPAAAAALFRLAADGEAAEPSPARDAVRQSAATILQARDAATADAGTRYWMIRSYEDFDNVVANSVQDQVRLQKLLTLLQRATADGDEPSLQAAAIALSSYDPGDNPSPALVAALRAAMASPAAANVLGDLNYAVQHLTGGQDF